MKKTLLVATILFIAVGLKAQKDSSAQKIISIKADTIKVGSISIIKGQGNKNIQVLIQNKKDTTVMFDTDTLKVGRFKIVKDENSTHYGLNQSKFESESESENPESDFESEFRLI